MPPRPFESIAPLSAELEQRLAARSELRYVVAADARVVAYAKHRWDQSAVTHGVPALADPSRILGKVLWAFLSGAEVLAAHRGFAAVLLNGLRERISVPFYTCGPASHADARLTIAPARLGDGAAALEYWVQEVSIPEVPSPRRMLDAHAAGSLDAVPLLHICSFCQYVRVPVLEGEVGAAAWMSPDQHEREFGAGPVRLSHGVCDACYEHVVRPQIAGARWRQACNAAKPGCESAGCTALPSPACPSVALPAVQPPEGTGR